MQVDSSFEQVESSLQHVSVEHVHSSVVEEDEEEHSSERDEGSEQLLRLLSSHLAMSSSMGLRLLVNSCSG